MCHVPSMSPCQALGQRHGCGRLPHLNIGCSTTQRSTMKLRRERQRSCECKAIVFPLLLHNLATSNFRTKGWQRPQLSNLETTRLQLPPGTTLHHTCPPNPKKNLYSFSLSREATLTGVKQKRPIPCHQRRHRGLPLSHPALDTSRHPTLSSQRLQQLLLPRLLRFTTQHIRAKHWRGA